MTEVFRSFPCMSNVYGDLFKSCPALPLKFNPLNRVAQLSRRGEDHLGESDASITWAEMEPDDWRAFQIF